MSPPAHAASRSQTPVHEARQRFDLDYDRNYDCDLLDNFGRPE